MRKAMLHEPNDPIPIRVKILSGPQVCFPFPGCAEVDIVAQILEKNEKFSHEVGDIIAVHVEKNLPKIDAEVLVHFFPSRYYHVGVDLIPSGAPKGRFCMPWRKP